MKSETAHDLIQTIADAINGAFAAHHKIMALEKALERCEPNLYQAYKTESDKILKNPPYALNLEALSALQSRIAQD